MVDKLPCVGFFQVMVKDGKVNLSQCDETRFAVPIVLDESDCVVLQILSRYRIQSDSDQILDEKPAKLEIHDGLTEKERAWREFKNQT